MIFILFLVDYLLCSTDFQSGVTDFVFFTKRVLPLKTYIFLKKYMKKTGFGPTIILVTSLDYLSGIACVFPYMNCSPKKGSQSVFPACIFWLCCQTLVPGAAVVFFYKPWVIFRHRKKIKIFRTFFLTFSAHRSCIFSKFPNFQILKNYVFLFENF